MTRLMIAAAIIVAAAVAGFVLRRRAAGHDAPTQGVASGSGYHVPSQLDRRDFDDPQAPWVVVVFSSATCNACDDIVRKALVLASHDVAVYVAEFPGDRVLHERYGIDGVPCVVIADRDGVVQRSFLGAVTATDLWAAVAAVRDPGGDVPGCP
jgi:hypothetical protein